MVDDERPQRVVVDIATPARWKVSAFWRSHGLRTFGLLAGFCPTTLAIGAEVFGSASTARGVAIFIGPFWIGAATLRLPADHILKEQKG